jgi:hypothetical protein
MCTHDVAWAKEAMHRSPAPSSNVALQTRESLALTLVALTDPTTCCPTGCRHQVRVRVDVADVLVSNRTTILDLIGVLTRIRP